MLKRLNGEFVDIRPGMLVETMTTTKGIIVINPGLSESDPIDGNLIEGHGVKNGSSYRVLPDSVTKVSSVTLNGSVTVPLHAILSGWCSHVLGDKQELWSYKKREITRDILENIPKDTVVELELDKEMYHFAGYNQNTNMVSLYKDGRSSKTVKHMGSDNTMWVMPIDIILSAEDYDNIKSSMEERER